MSVDYHKRYSAATVDSDGEMPACKRLEAFREFLQRYDKAVENSGHGARQKTGSVPN